MIQINVPSKLRARAFLLARTAFLYTAWRMLGIGLECYCSQSRPMRAQRIKLEGTLIQIQTDLFCIIFVFGFFKS